MIDVFALVRGSVPVCHTQTRHVSSRLVLLCRCQLSSELRLGRRLRRRRKSRPQKRWARHGNSEQWFLIFCDVIDGNAPGHEQGLPRWLPTLPQHQKDFNSTMLDW